MSDAPRRRRFQVHLSTAIVLMFAAGTFLWTNMRKQNVDPFEDFYETNVSLDLDRELPGEVGVIHWISVEAGRTVTSESFRYGWPFIVMDDTVEARQFPDGHTIKGVHTGPNWHRKGVIINSLIALVDFVLLASCGEWMIRRRSARKGGRSMQDAPRRRRFQVHLSTAIVLMFAAGALVWVNLCVRWGITHRYSFFQERGMGWPVIFLATDDGGYAGSEWNPNPFVDIQYDVAYSMLFLDLQAAFLILYSIWYASEWWIGRRLARKFGGARPEAPH